MGLIRRTHMVVGRVRAYAMEKLKAIAWVIMGIILIFMAIFGFIINAILSHLGLSIDIINWINTIVLIVGIWAVIRGIIKWYFTRFAIPY